MDQKTSPHSFRQQGVWKIPLRPEINEALPFMEDAILRFNFMHRDDYGYVGFRSSLIGNPQNLPDFDFKLDPVIEIEQHPTKRSDDGMPLYTLTVRFSESHNFPESASVMSESAKSEAKGYTFTLKDLTHNKLVAIRHNLVAESLTGKETDVKPTDYFPGFVGAINKLTPDYIHVHDKFAHIIDFKTKKEDRNLDDAYAEACVLYVQDAIERSKFFGGTIYYSGVIVSNERVLSPFDFTDKALAAIAAHYRLGVMIERVAIERGFIKDIIEEETLIFNELLTRHIDDLKADIPTRVEFPETPYITQEMIAAWDNKSRADVIKENDDTLIELVLNSMQVLSEDSKKDSYKPALKCRMEFEKEWDNSNCRSIHTEINKSFIQLPLLVPLTPPEDRRDFELDPYDITGNSFMERIWKKALFSRKSAPYGMFNTAKEQVENNLNLSMMDKEQYKKAVSVHKRERGRIQMDFNSEEKAELATKGVFGKSMRKLQSVISHKEESRKPFHRKCFTGDVDHFMERMGLDLLNELCYGWDILKDRHRKIYDLGKEGPNSIGKQNVEFSQDAEHFMDFFLKSKLGASLTVLDMILDEINVSINQHCTAKQFIIKKVPNCQIYLLIKPTSAEKHIHFSILALKSHFEAKKLPFKVCNETKDFYITDFVSINRHRLSGLLGLPFKVCCMYAMTCEIFDVEPLAIVSNTTENLRVKKHFLLALLILLESKTQTSANLQQIRYMYMKTMKVKRLYANPLENLVKLDPRPKSRLLVWIYNRILDAFTLMTEKRPSISASEIAKIRNPADAKNEDEVSGDVFNDLLSWVDGSEIPNYKIALNLSYLGVLHNKDDAEQIHGFLKIFEKVVKEELNLRKADIENMGYSSLPASKLKDHEFNTNHARACGIRIKAEIMKKQNLTDTKKFDHWLLTEIARKSHHTTIEEFATMKASAVIDHDGTYTSEAVTLHGLPSRG
jgi:hypothetical protein